MEKSQSLESAEFASDLGHAPYKVCHLWYVIISKCVIFKMKILITLISQDYNERNNNIYVQSCFPNSLFYIGYNYVIDFDV